MAGTGIALTDKEFFTQMARFADVTNIATVQKYWYAAVEVIIRELFYNGTCRCPGLGTFSTKVLEEKIQVHKGKDGKKAAYKVPERIYPVFTPQDDMINDINMQGVTKEYRKRLKKQKLTKRDYERHARAEALGIVGNMTEQRQEAAKEKFHKMLQAKKEAIKGKVDSEEDDED